MISLRLKDLQYIKDSSIVHPAEKEIFEAPIRGISIDTRTMQPQEIFWAIKGESMDGHWFVADAEKNGAVAVVVEKRKAKRLPEVKIPLITVKNTLVSLQQFAGWHRSRFNIPILAITGTNGKTTTKEMITWILQTKFNIHKTIGNLNNHIGTPLTMLRLNSDHQISIVEVGTNHPGEIELLGSMVKPTSALITNIGMGHLEFFSDLKGVANEKLSLFRSLRRNGVVFLNNDDVQLRRARIRRKNMYKYSLQENSKCKISGKLLRLTREGFGIWKLNDRTTIQMQVPGIQNVQNALAASTVALHFGMKESLIKDALESYRAYDKRMQIIDNDNTVIINDTYNANPDSFIPALQTLSHLAEDRESRKIVVIGDMLELGQRAGKLHDDLFDRLMQHKVDGIFTNGKACKKAADNIRKAGYSSAFSFDSQKELAKALREFIKRGDVILLKGSRGMQMEKVLAYL